MELEQFEALRQTVLWSAFAVSLAFGFIAQRSHFCTMGAFSDIVNMGDWTRMRLWAMAVAVATLGFYGLAATGQIDPSETFYTRPRVLWLSSLVGGGLFGFGMVLASGCGSKTLVRIGAGSLKSLVVFAVMGLAAFATLRGLTAVLRVNTVDLVAFDFPMGASLPLGLSHVTGWSAAQSGMVAALVVATGLVLWCLRSPHFRTPLNLFGGIGLGLTVVAMWWVSGQLGFVAEHPETLDSVFVGSNSGRMESLTFTAPMAYTLDWLIYFSDSAKLLSFGVVSVLGVVVGAWLCARTTNSFRWEGFRDTQDTALHLGGALCMGVGGVTALGCTVGQGLSGLSTLSLGSAIAVLGLWGGAVLGLRFQLWLLERE